LTPQAEEAYRREYRRLLESTVHSDYRGVVAADPKMLDEAMWPIWESVRADLKDGGAWLFDASPPRHGRRPAVVAERFNPIFWLQRPRESEDADWLIVGYEPRAPTKWERMEMLGGRELDGAIVLPSSGAPPICPFCGCHVGASGERGLTCPECGRELPKHLAVQQEIAVALKDEAYHGLLDAQKQPINAEWAIVKRGRTVREAQWEGETVFLLTLTDDDHPSTVADFEQLNELLTESGCGRVTTDPYELKLLHRLAKAHDRLKATET
jgi:hypothetical protein